MTLHVGACILCTGFAVTSTAASLFGVETEPRTHCRKFIMMPVTGRCYPYLLLVRTAPFGGDDLTVLELIFRGIASAF